MWRGGVGTPPDPYDLYSTSLRPLFHSFFSIFSIFSLYFYFTLLHTFIQVTKTKVNIINMLFLLYLDYIWTKMKKTFVFYEKFKIRFRGISVDFIKEGLNRIKLIIGFSQFLLLFIPDET